MLGPPTPQTIAPVTVIVIDWVAIIVESKKAGELE
tara:strand:+ start:3807 stop:3911 length:105 start_codon:yes stop_codon:yes gene_type:complete